METAVIRKEELLSMLENMNTQLTNLECAITVHINNQHDEWIKEHESKVNFFDEQLELLDKKITSINEHNENHQTTSIRLTFSY